jgi:hypothetical protein
VPGDHVVKSVERLRPVLPRHSPLFLDRGGGGGFQRDDPLPDGQQRLAPAFIERDGSQQSGMKGRTRRRLPGAVDKAKYYHQPPRPDDPPNTPCTSTRDPLPSVASSENRTMPPGRGSISQFLTATDGGSNQRTKWAGSVQRSRYLSQTQAEILPYERGPENRVCEYLLVLWNEAPVWPIRNRNKSLARADAFLPKINQFNCRPGLK